MKRITFISTALAGITVLCLALQVCISSEYDNLVSATLASASVLLFLFYLGSSKPISDSPLSTIALLGYVVTGIYASLLSQTLSWRALSEGLRGPVETYSTLSIVLLIGTSTHFLYRKLVSLREVSERIGAILVKPLQIDRPPPPLYIWILSPLGFAPFLMGSSEIGNVSGKAVDALSFLVWLPFLIPAYYRIYGERYCNLNHQIGLLLVHISLLVIVGVAINARQIMFIGPMTALLLYFLVSASDLRPIPRRSIIKTLVAAAFFVIGIQYSADIITAMEVVRGKRDGASFSEMISETTQTLFDDFAIRSYREQQSLKSILSQYDENYLSNPLLGRLSETKFHDNMIYFSGTFNESQQREVIEKIKSKTVTILPQPILDALKVKEKKEDTLHSMGDVYKAQVTGQPLGGYATGSIWADVLVISGPLWPILTAALCLSSFILLDSMQTSTKALQTIAPPALCLIWTIFIYGLGGESIAHKAFLFFRQIPEKILVYGVLLFLLRSFIKQKEAYHLCSEDVRQ